MREGVRIAVGRLLRQLRSRRGLTLARVAELTAGFGNRVSRSRLSQLERGDVPVNLDDVQVLCRVYGIGIVDLFVEVLAAAPPDRFPADRDGEQLFAEARGIYDRGDILEAAWTFETAAARTVDPHRRALALLSAGHCYDRLGGSSLAIRLVERGLDLLDHETDTVLRATAKLAVLLAASGAHLRARVFLDRVLGNLDRRRQPRSLRAYLLGAAATCSASLGDVRRAISMARSSARLYRKIGRPDMALLKLSGAIRLAVGSHRLRSVAAARDTSEVEELLRGASEVYAGAYAHLALGEYRAGLGHREEARAALLVAWQQAATHGISRLATPAARLLASLDETDGSLFASGHWKRVASGTPRVPGVASALRPRGFPGNDPATVTGEERGDARPARRTGIGATRDLPARRNPASRPEGVG